MPFKSKEFIDSIIEAIIDFQTDELLSDRELSKMAGLSPTMVSKIKNWKTIPKLSTIRKLRDVWVQVRRPWQRPNHAEWTVGISRQPSHHEMQATASESRPQS